MFEIKPVREHYEVFCNGKFFCSADTESEAKQDIETFTDIYKAEQEYEKMIWGQGK